MKRKNRIVALFNRQAGVCAITGEKMTLKLGERNTATIDHLVPKSILGRAFREHNEVAVTHWVNNLKGDRPLSEIVGLIARKHEQ